MNALFDAADLIVHLRENSKATANLYEG